MAEYQNVVDNQFEALTDVTEYAAEFARGYMHGLPFGIDFPATMTELMLPHAQEAEDSADMTAIGSKSMARWNRGEEGNTVPGYVGAGFGAGTGLLANAVTYGAPAVLATYLDAWNSDTLHNAYDSVVDFSKGVYHGTGDAISAFSDTYHDYVERGDEVMTGEGDVGEVDEMLED